MQFNPNKSTEVKKEKEQGENHEIDQSAPRQYFGKTTGSRPFREVLTEYQLIIEYRHHRCNEKARDGSQINKSFELTDEENNDHKGAQ